MPSISCFYIHYNREPINIIFVKYENFIKIFLNEKSVILTIQQLLSIRELFQIYLISLLLTEDTSKISFDIEHYRNVYGVSTIRYWKNLHLTSTYNVVLLEKNPHKNPLNANEPKRSTSLKKINKFLKKFDKYIDDNYIVDVERFLMNIIPWKPHRFSIIFRDISSTKKRLKCCLLFFTTMGKMFIVLLESICK